MLVNGSHGGCGSRCGCVATDSTGSNAEEVIAKLILVVLLKEVKVALGTEDKMCCLTADSVLFKRCVFHECSARVSDNNFFCVEIHGNGRCSCPQNTVSWNS